MIQFSGTEAFFTRSVQSACPSLGSTVSEFSEAPWYISWASEGEKPSLVRSWKNTRETLPDMLCLSSACAVSVILTSSFSLVSSLDPGAGTEASHLSCLPLNQASREAASKGTDSLTPLLLWLRCHQPVKPPSLCISASGPQGRENSTGIPLLGSCARFDTPAFSTRFKRNWRAWIPASACLINRVPRC